MSKEKEALDEYISQQQQKINDLTQTVLLLQTRNILLEKELLAFRGYILEKNEIQVSRGSVLNHISKVRVEETKETKEINNFSNLKNKSYK
jgi:hypothetical protein